MRSSERLFPAGSEVLGFTYRGEAVTVPVVSTFEDFRREIRAVVVPGLEELKRHAEPGRMVGIGFVQYNYSVDRYDLRKPEVASELFRILNTSGFSGTEWPTPSAIIPERHCLVSEMRKQGDNPFPSDFAEGTYIAGPMIVRPSLHPTLENVRFVTEASVGIDGMTLLSEMDAPVERRRVFDREIVALLDRAFAPFTLE